MFLDELLFERANLKQLEERASEDLSSSPPGSLRIAHTKSRPSYYHREVPSDRKGKYIKKSDIRLAQALAQKGYAQKVIGAVEPKITEIDMLIDEYSNNNLLGISESYNSARRDLINPYIINDEEYVQRWLETPYIPNPSFTEHLIFETANGIKVRSKSEQIIAENLSRLGIPYKYEAPLFYAPDLAVYPDFTLLNVRRRKIIYYEHFGKMNDEGYLNYFFLTIKIYNQLGVVLGKNFICTFEDQKHPFDFASNRVLFEEMLLK